MWEQWGVEILAFLMTWHIAYTTAWCYRTSRDRATATSYRLSKVTTFLSSAVWLQFWMQYCCLQPSLTVIIISWENRQKVLNIVVCYGLTIFHKTGYKLRLDVDELKQRLVEVWSGLRQTVVRWRNRRMEKTSPGLCSSKRTALWTSAVTFDYDVANQQFVQLQTLAL